jgi:acyl transferase domain-containing protein
MTHPQQPDAQLTPLKRAFLALEEMQQKLDAAQKAAKEPAAREPVAVIGVGCRFPGGVNTPAAYWELLRRGGQAVSEPPPGREAVVEGVGGSLRAGWLQEPVDHFDPHFFGIAPREAHGMDPQQRLLLEVAWEALESACQAPDRLDGTRTGVYVGVSANDYLHVYLKEADAALFDGYYASGISHSIASGRLSYLLGLQGPSISLDTACSSSLSAVHLAVQSLRSGETDMALAGGVHLMLAPENFLAFDRFGMLAADGSCKTFDAAADGFGRGEGCGVVVLKRLSDAVAHGDRILAVIRGSAMNQDGASSGLTAPNGPAQEAVVRTALEQAGIDPALVSFIETHGTGTSLGDPIEVQALGAVFGPSHSAQQPLLLGAVKASLGHTEAAAGVAGLIKLVLSLQHGEIPPQANFHTPSPFIPWAKLPFVVPLQATAWPPVEGRRIGGISAFGFSGTNVHVVVEAAPEARLGSQTSSSAGEQAAAEDERPLHLLALSARQPAALAQLAGRYAGSLEAAKEARLRLADICYSANSGRAHLPYRLTVVGASTAEMAQKLAAFAAGEEAAGALSGLAEGPKPKIAFLFTGQGAQYAGMGRQLYATQPVFRAALDRCDAILRQHLAVPLLEVIDPPAEAASRLDDTTYTQPALFAIEYALAQLWQSWGVMPNFVMGHSIGELVAATVAGVFSLEDGLKLVAARGRLMGALPTGGAMAAVFAGESRVAAAIAPHAKTVAIAALNGPDSTVISGRGEDVEIILDHLRAEGIKARPLKVSHAFHSPLMEPMLEPFAQVAAGIAYAAPRIRLVSNVTGEVAPGMTVANAAYWRDHARAPVRFCRRYRDLAAAGRCGIS